MFFRVSSSALGTSNFAPFFRRFACWIIFLKQYIYMNSTLASPPIAWHELGFTHTFFLIKAKGTFEHLEAPRGSFLLFTPQKNEQRKRIHHGNPPKRTTETSVISRGLGCRWMGPGQQMVTCRSSPSEPPSGQHRAW